MVRNLFEILAFHDEREIKKDKWLYHGFIFCEVTQLTSLLNELLEAKRESDCLIEKRIRFHDLNSKSTGSASTKTAVKWAKLFRDKLPSIMWFYLLGINKANINYDFFGPASDGRDRHFRIYNKFFEMGLYAACRWFFDKATTDVEIVNIFSEKRSLEKHNPFTFHAPYMINQRESNIKVIAKKITQIASTPSREKIYPDYVHILNLVDILTGSFSEVFDYTTKKDGCVEVAEKLYDVCSNIANKPYNEKSRYYKKYAISFFPKQRREISQVTDFETKEAENQFYQKRPLCLNQPRLFNL